MTRLVVASVQQQIRLFAALEDYRKELNRFFSLARAKSAALIVFPALTGVMAVAPQVEGFRINLLKRADERFRRQQSLWARTKGAIAGRTASILKVSFRNALAELAAEDPGALRSNYEAVFADLAKAYQMTVVGGSAYLADDGGALRHQAVIFGPDGAILARRNKVVLGPEEDGLAQPGDGWSVIETPAGRLGLLLGEEALYPEAGRVLAYGGADLLVTIGASDNEALAAHIRQATLARAQDNQCYALTSFLIGRNYLADGDGPARDFLGKSGIYAPLQMTPRNSGILVEIGTANSEGLLTAELHMDELRQQQLEGAAPVRIRMPMQVFATQLAGIYERGKTLAEAVSELAEAGEPEVAGELMPGESEVIGAEASPVDDVHAVASADVAVAPAEAASQADAEGAPAEAASQTNVEGAPAEPEIQTNAEGAPAEPASQTIAEEAPAQNESTDAEDQTHF